MWTYEQATGRLTRDGVFIGTGYSGHGAGLDTPALQNVEDVGPLPCGFYTIGPAFNDAHTGPCSMRLTPDINNIMFGRFGFMLHGNDAANDLNASEGCIVLAHEIRELISETPDKRLQVIAGL